MKTSRFDIFWVKYLRYVGHLIIIYKKKKKKKKNSVACVSINFIRNNQVKYVVSNVREREMIYYVVAKKILIVDDLPAGHLGQVESQFHQSSVHQ